jgi:hypothetical protein
MRSRDRRLAKTAAWACGNLIRGAKGPALISASEMGDIALRALATATATATAADSSGAPSGPGSVTDPLGFELATEMAWVLSMVTAGDEDVCAPLIAAGAFKAAVRGLSSGHTPLITPCLRILGNLMSLQLSYLDEALAQPALLPTLCAIITPQQDDRGGVATDGAGGMFDSDDVDVAVSSLLPDPAHHAAIGSSLTASLQPSRTRFRVGHVKEALWVVSNLLGGSPAHTAAVLTSPAWQWSPSLPPHSGLPLPLAHMLASHLLHSPWPVKIEAAMCFANLSMQRAVISVAGLPAAGSRPLSPHPFLAIMLSFDTVLREFLSLLQGMSGLRGGLKLANRTYLVLFRALLCHPNTTFHLLALDVATVRMALSVVDIVLHAWKPPPAAAAALLERAPLLSVDPALAALLERAGPDRSGPALVQDAGGIDALEQVRRHERMHGLD